MRAWLLAVVVLAGCSPTLRDGYYACADNHCPAGYVCWRADQLCHTHAETPMFDTGVMPMPDAGGSTCSVGSCPPMQSCVVGAWTGPTPTYACATASQVVTVQHGMTCVPGPAACAAPDACIMNAAGNHCMRPCGMAGDPCLFMEDCVPQHVCAEPCGTGGTCVRPGFSCSSGHCLPTGW